MKEQEIKDSYVVEGCSCVEKAEVYGLASSIRRAKFPMAINIDCVSGNITEGIIGLAQCEKGTGHDQWLTGVTVQMDLKFTNKAWVEAERYRFLYFISSQSTMHRIARFELDDAYIEYVDDRIINIMKEKVKQYNELVESDANDEETEKKYLEILYSNPAGFRLTAGITTNYRQLKTIYSQRKNHRLPEWREFCKWIETLPHSYLITGKD